MTKTPTNKPKTFKLIPAPWTLCIALIATLFVILTIDAAGRGTSRYLNAPGITLDESFNLQQGFLLWGALRIYGWNFFNPISQMEIYNDELYLEDHPPLGRWWIGGVHEFLRMTLGSEDKLEEAYGRVGSALAYGLLIYLAGYFATRWWGTLAGVFCAFCVATMPRLFGHAHLASLESCVNLTYCLTVFYLVDRWANFSTAESSNTQAIPKTGWMIPGLSYRTIFISGVLLGLALLTKIQGVFLPIPLAIYAFCIWRQQALLPVILFGLIGVLTFFLCWPYLWLEPVEHLLNYLGRSTERITIHNYYLGEIYDDKQTPWHYPWMMFIYVVPLGFIISATGCVFLTIRNERRVQLLLLNCFFPLVVFTLPVAKYDGDRLFLMVFPLYAMLAGYGLKLIFTSKHSFRYLFICFQTVMSIIIPLATLVMNHPGQINQWSLTASMLTDLKKLEANYWADGMTASFMGDVNNKIEPNTTIFVTPVMHQFQLLDIKHQHKFLREKNITLEPFPDDLSLTKLKPDSKYYLLSFRRLADYPVDRINKLIQEKRLFNLVHGQSMARDRADFYEFKIEGINH
jgi:hypothetical protein